LRGAELIAALLLLGPQQIVYAQPAEAPAGSMTERPPIPPTLKAMAKLAYVSGGCEQNLPPNITESAKRGYRTTEGGSVAERERAAFLAALYADGRERSRVAPLNRAECLKLLAHALQEVEAAQAAASTARPN